MIFLLIIFSMPESVSRVNEGHSKSTLEVRRGRRRRMGEECNSLEIIILIFLVNNMVSYVIPL